MNAHNPRTNGMMRTPTLSMRLVLALGLVTLSLGALAAGPAPVDLGSAGDFVILAKSAISATWTTAIVGDIGVSPAAASYITGFGLILDPSTTFATSSMITGEVYAADYTLPTPTKMTTAVSDMETAYTDAAGRPTPDFTELYAGDLTGKILVPGLYKWGTGVLVSAGGVTLSGTADDVWIFQIAQDLDLASGAAVTLAGGAQAANVFWQVAGQATLGTTAAMKGIILSQTAIVMANGATLDGKALAQTAVTMDANSVSEAPLLVNAAPVAVDDTYSTPEDVTLTVPIAGVLVNDTDADGDPLTAIKVTNPLHGTVTLNANGSLVYVPTAGYAGPDSFTYKANDGTLDSNVVTVTITVTNVNVAPVAVANSYTTFEDTTLTVPAPGVLANDTDADGDALTAIKVTNPLHGTVTFNANGSFTYVPTAGYHGPDSFTYKANDGALDSNTVVISLTVIEVVPLSARRVVVYDYKASIKRMDLFLGKFKYSQDVYDGKNTVTVPWDSYTTEKDTLKGYLLIPVCVGCTEDGTDTSQGMESFMAVLRKGDKSKGVLAVYPLVSAAVFAKTVGGRPADDDLAGGPFSLKKLDEAWMSMVYAVPMVEDVYESTKFGMIPAGFLGMGFAQAEALVHAGFGKATVVNPKTDPGLCGNVGRDASCLTVTSINGSLVGQTEQTYLCELAIWDLCSFTTTTPAGATVDTAVVHGSWSVKYNKKMTLAVNALDGDADAIADLLAEKLGGKYWMGDGIVLE